MISSLNVALSSELRSAMTAARMAYHTGDFKLCAKHCTKAIEIIDRNDLDETVSCEALIYLSICCSARREFREAEVLLGKALSINQADPQCDNVLLAFNYHEFSVLYWKTERITDSQTMNDKALAALEQAQSGVAELKVMVLRQKAVLLGANHEFTKADAVLDNALDLCSRASELGKNSLAYGQTLITKIFVCIDSGRLQEARELYFQAIQVLEMNLGIHHPKLADLYEIFAKHLKGTNHEETSDLFQQKSKEIRAWIKHSSW